MASQDPVEERDAGIEAKALEGAKIHNEHELEFLGPKTLPKQRICVEILMEGYVNSFVDFFYLTHGKDGAEGDYKLDPVFLKNRLIIAEQAKREGKPKVMFSAYKDLAEQAQAEEEFETANGFFQKCLEIAQLTGDVERERLANHDLGIVHEKAMDILAAIQYHETHLELAEKTGDKDGSTKANEHLVPVYRSHAAQLVNEEKYEEAVSYYQNALKAALACKDEISEGFTYYDLGRCCYELGEIDDCIQYHKKYYDACRGMSDFEGEGQACSALAKAYQAKGDIPTAIVHLEQYLKISQDIGKVSFQGQACAALGSLYVKNEDYPAAVEFFEKEFKLKRSLGEKKPVDEARVNVGVAKGNARLAQFMGLVNSDIDSLLEWKNLRSGIV